MAKKKGKREETFTFPEFKREEYRTKEVRDSKVAIFAVFYAVFIALICYFIVRMTDLGSIVVFLGFAAPFGLIPILPHITDTSEFERKNWFGPIFMSFMAWLGLFILLSNPPFNDIAKPKFQQMELYTEVEGGWNTTLELGSDTPFVLLISVKDNWEIDNVQVSGSKGGSGFMSYEMMTKLEDSNQFGIAADNMYYYHFEDGLNMAAYSFTFKAVDEDGNSNTKRYSFVVG
ncbi:MAG: hypothetical protein NZ842_06735 [Dehalococcoidia bacterium]|nr:hypothetical protein [Dehalococcoidia bacterium]